MYNLDFKNDISYQDTYEFDRSCKISIDQWKKWLQKYLTASRRNVTVYIIHGNFY